MTDDQFNRAAVSHYETSEPEPKPADSEHDFNPLAHGRLFLPLPVEVASSRDLTDREKVVYAALLRRHGKEGGCYPSHARLVRDTGKCLTSVKAAIAGLKRKGFIRVRRRGRKQTNLYEFLRHRVFEQPDWVGVGDGIRDLRARHPTEPSLETCEFPLIPPGRARVHGLKKVG